MPKDEASTALSELRQDLEHSSRFRLQVGAVLVLASVAMTFAGWQAVELFNMPLAILFGSLPTALLGAGVIVKELGRARGERRRLARADEGEVSELRAAIAADERRTLLRGDEE